MTARDHNNLLGIFFLIKGGLILLVGILMTLIYAGVGVAMFGTARREEEQIAGGIMFVAGVFIGLIIIAVAAFVLFTGLKIRKQAPIGRTLGIIASVLTLFNFPIGTALGVYGLWFLLGDLGRGLYSGVSPGPGYSAPPPPNSWQ